jgi:hypothetical protein
MTRNPESRVGPPCPRCGKPMSHRARGTGSCRTCTARSCEVCGAAYKPSYSEQRTCGRECGARLKPAALKGQAVKIGCLLEWHQCAECPAWIGRPDRKVCSDECSRARGRRRYYETFVSEAQPCTKRCEDCGEPHTTATARNGGVCKQCRARRAKREVGTSDRKRARFYGVAYEPIKRSVVYARDRWVCGLCGKRVRKDKKAPHPLSPSLDHIVPMAEGGDHLYANVQCAHFLCNSLKGTGGSQQLALVG